MGRCAHVWRKTQQRRWRYIRLRQPGRRGHFATGEKPDQSPGAAIYYRDIGDYLTREQKLDILAKSGLATTEWEVVTPNAHGDWIGQRNDSFAAFRPLSDGSAAANKGLAPIFERQTLGLVTSRDAWCYNSSAQKLRDNIARSMAFYNAQVDAFQATGPVSTRPERRSQARAFVAQYPQQFHRSRENYHDLANGKTYAVNDAGFTVSAYRPFFKQRLYCDPRLNNSIRDFPEIYPSADNENLGIYITGSGS